MLAKTKMKLSASGDRGVPEESRFYLRVVMDAPAAAGGGSMPSKALFFSGRVSVGKVLDRCAEAFGVQVRPVGDEGTIASQARTASQACIFELRSHAAPVGVRLAFDLLYAHTSSCPQCAEYFPCATRPMHRQCIPLLSAHTLWQPVKGINLAVLAQTTPLATPF